MLKANGGHFGGHFGGSGEFIEPAADEYFEKKIVFLINFYHF
jgi:hypothetical protein